MEAKSVNTSANSPQPSTSSSQPSAPETPNRQPSPSAHSKPCTLCQTPRDVLVRCRIDGTQTWHFVCPGKCWKSVSGGAIDGPDKPYYQYGGMWKNKHAGVSAKKPKRKSKDKEEAVREWRDVGVKYTVNDRVQSRGLVWVCRRSHDSDEGNEPGRGYHYWKEV